MMSCTYVLHFFHLPLIHLFDGWSTGVSSITALLTSREPFSSGHTTAWHTSGHSTGSPARLLVEFGDDRRTDFLQLFLVVFKFVFLGRLWEIKKRQFLPLVLMNDIGSAATIKDYRTNMMLIIL